MTTPKAASISIGRRTLPNLDADLGAPRIGAANSGSTAAAVMASSTGATPVGHLRMRVTAGTAGTPTGLAYYINAAGETGLGPADRAELLTPASDLWKVLPSYRALAAADLIRYGSGAGTVAYSGTATIAASAPSDGVTNGATGDLIFATTPDTLHVCINGATDDWELVDTNYVAAAPETTTVADIVGTAANGYRPANLVPGYGAGDFGRGSLVFASGLSFDGTARATDGWYLNVGTIRYPVWTIATLSYPWD